MSLNAANNKAKEQQQQQRRRTTTPHPLSLRRYLTQTPHPPLHPHPSPPRTVTQRLRTRGETQQSNKTGRLKYMNKVFFSKEEKTATSFNLFARAPIHTHTHTHTRNHFSSTPPPSPTPPLTQSYSSPPPPPFSSRGEIPRGYFVGVYLSLRFVHYSSTRSCLPSYRPPPLLPSPLLSSPSPPVLQEVPVRANVCARTSHEYVCLSATSSAPRQKKRGSPPPSPHTPVLLDLLRPFFT